MHIEVRTFITEMAKEITLFLKERVSILEEKKKQLATALQTDAELEEKFKGHKFPLINLDENTKKSYEDNLKIVTDELERAKMRIKYFEDKSKTIMMKKGEKDG